MTGRELDPDPPAEPASEPDEGTTADRARPPASAGRRVGRWGRELVIVVVGALVVSSLLRMFVGQMFVIPSGSMENTLLVNDRVVAQKFDGFDGVQFSRGQIVVFADPGDPRWLDEPIPERGPVRRAMEFIGVVPSSATGYLIKRVIGMPGDTVVCCADGRVTVNGHALEEADYLYIDDNGDQVDPSDVTFRVVVPAGRIFVMGDHRDDSRDSRCHLDEPSADQPEGMNAFVPIGNVVGPAVAIASPLSRLRTLPVPSTFAGVPSSSSPAPTEPVIEPAGVHC